VDDKEANEQCVDSCNQAFSVTKEEDLAAEAEEDEWVEVEEEAEDLESSDRNTGHSEAASADELEEVLETSPAFELLDESLAEVLIRDISLDE
jgi:hypothetical protein